ncbi:MinD/ParA family protein [Nostoc sp. FACHB-87]|uniref:MinD/ParA family ATP-binding protein n=1 Tax=Nostocales TaxID=1161 RepID=UPI001683D4A3|nr:MULTISPECIES: MinD/ParA family protein [Nostocales]MBD2299688.1 MinD/ParA family protein [Nostoc sp. FACHB-190]MBD2457464.1 MinD/ParA family protein [Nostoc sp. FACHB-87]MBD2477568.1 MinD/ParA family protein [Anabaena sp. FACHB-83]MBD2489595.1 MinD/ParA family protein [Aulosira sp. FACHB-615]
MSKIISIHSFRGGTGKSNTIANIAATMAIQGKRVAIIDTDIQSPGVHIIFGLNEHKIEYSLNDYLWGRCEMKDAAYDVTHTLINRQQSSNQIKGNLYLVPSSIKAGEISRIIREGYDVVRLNDGFQELIVSLNLDYLFIDTHPGLNEETLISIGISHVLIVVLRPDQQDFQGTAVTVDVARKLRVPKMLLVINKALSSLNFPDLQQQVESIYNVSVAGILPLSEDMAELGSKDIFTVQYPEHPISQTVQKIAAQIADVAA